MATATSRPDRRRRARTDGTRPTTPLPCDRCTTVQPLYPNGHELLCLTCMPGVGRQR